MVTSSSPTGRRLRTRGHIGFAIDPETVDDLVDAVTWAGRSLLMQFGEDTSERTVFVTDPDGYALQLG